MFAFGKRLSRVEHDIIAYDILFFREQYINPLKKYVKTYNNLAGNIVTPSCKYEYPVSKVRINRVKVDKGLYLYRYGFKTFSAKPAKQKNCVVVPVIIPAGAYYSYNLFGQILSTEIIYPNKF